MPGEDGHITVDFPLRPGETRFAVNYTIPYDGSASFAPRLAYPLRQLAVMVPRSMRFASTSRAFHLLESQKEFEVEALNDVPADEALGFDVSGQGLLPPLTEANLSRGTALATASARGNMGRGSWLLGGLLVAFGLLGALCYWRISS